MFYRFPRNKEKIKTWTPFLSKDRSVFTTSHGSRIAQMNLNTDKQLQRIQIQRCG